MSTSTTVDYVAGARWSRTRRRAAPAGRPGRGAHREPGAARLLQVRRLLPRLARRASAAPSALGTAVPGAARSCCRSASRSTRSTRCRTRSTSSAGECGRPGTSSHYAAFVAMFPHLIAGPIVRYATIDDQLRKLAPRLTSAARRVRACSSSRCGLVEEAPDRRHARAARRPPVRRARPPRAGRRLGGGLGYALQLYFDFSGYSDMAVGLAFLLGFRFPQNFNSPYKSREHLRLLAALAHVALVLAARLPVHPARRLAQRALADAAQPGRHDVPGRALARRGVDVRRLGAAPRASPDRATTCCAAPA